MAVQDVLQIGNPILRNISAEVSRFGPALDQTLIDLGDTLTFFQETKQIGSAIAAPQIGILQRIVYIQTADENYYMINPTITSKSTKTFEVWDSCFCFDVAFFVKIRRHREIAVDFQDEAGKRYSRTYTDDLSELFQHEIDHLDGILATDHLADPKNIVMRCEWEKLQGSV